MVRSATTLIARASNAVAGDRKLDSEIVAFVLGPPGCVVDPVEGLDGWDIQSGPDSDAQSECWREAADVAPVTAYLDAAAELVIEARPQDAAMILTRAVKRPGAARKIFSGEEFVGRLARMMVAELLETIAAESRGRVAQAA